MKPNLYDKAGNEGSPFSRLTRTEMIVYNAFASLNAQKNTHDLVKQIVKTTKFSELQVRAALFLLLQKKIITCTEIIDTE